MTTMPRKARFYAAGIPCHIVQRGNNRQACFFSNQDFAFYINVLTEALDTYCVKLHAFVLMTNHVHLLMTPNCHEGISNVMQSTGRKYVRYINGLYNRTGTLWEGRHKASLIDSSKYLLICQRYIELNPVRANMVIRPIDYRWSSYQANANGKSIKCITPHPEYLSLGTSKEQREHAYREIFGHVLLPEQIHQLRECLQHNYPLGSDNFKNQIEQTLNAKIGQLKPGRPANK
jgi:putative transposase